MSELPVQKRDFKVDTHRPRSRSKMRSKFRHITAVAAGMFPLMALFVLIMALFQIELQRRGLYKLAVIFFGCGMVSLLMYAWARSEKLRRHEVSRRNRAQRQRDMAAALQREREKRTAAASSAAPAGEG